MNAAPNLEKIDRSQFPKFTRYWTKRPDHFKDLFHLAPSEQNLRLAFHSTEEAWDECMLHQVFGLPL